MWQRAISVEWIFNAPPLPSDLFMFLGHICLAHSRSLPVTFPLTEEAWSHHGGVITFLSARRRSGKERHLDQAILKKWCRPRGEVIDICYPVHLFNIILPFNSFDRSCFPPCQSQLVEGLRDWTSTGGQEYCNYTQRRGGGGRGGLCLVMFDVIYPTAPGVHLNGGSCDAVTLTEPCNQLDLSECERLRKPAVTAWVTVHHNHPPPTPLPPPVLRENGGEGRDLRRERQINHLSLLGIRLPLNWNHWLEELQLPNLCLFETPPVWEKLKNAL